MGVGPPIVITKILSEESFGASCCLFPGRIRGRERACACKKNGVKLNKLKGVNMVVSNEECYYVVIKEQTEIYQSGKK